MAAGIRNGSLAAGLLVSGFCAGSFALGQTLDEANRLYGEGRIAESIAAFRQVAESVEDDDPATAGRARNNACVLLTDTGVFAEALIECEQALALRESVGDTRQLARTLNNMGRVLQHLARYDEAEARFRQALALNRANDDVQGETINWSNLGGLATQAGRYSQALDAHQRVQRLAAANADAPWAAGQQLLARINQAVVLERLGAYREALAAYEEVLEGQAALPEQQRAALLVNRGVVYRNLGDPVRAKSAFEQAIPVYTGLGDRAGLSNVWLNIGLVQHLNFERPRAAEAAYREAYRLAEASGDRTEAIQDLFYLGRLLLDTEQLQEAERVYSRCLAESDEAGSGEGRWASLAGLARIALARGDRHAALSQVLLAIEEIERVRQSLPGGKLRAGYFGDKRPVYDLAVSILAALEVAEPGENHAVRAFELVQRAKARVLLDALGSGASAGEPLPLPRLLAALKNDTLIEYFVTDVDLFAWVVHGDGIEMRNLGSSRPILERVGEIHEALARGDDPRLETLRAVSAELLGTFSTWPDSEELRIAPDGRLHYLPFELLSHPAFPDSRLIERTTVSYLPSGSTLGRSRPPGSPAAIGLVGFGDPQSVADPDQISTVDLWAKRFDLGPLPAAAEELKNLDRWLPGEHVLRTREQATEAEFRAVVSRGSKVVHLASHTVIDERPGRGAAILLAPGEGADGLLHPHEIAALDYPVDLTVLAACRTALGAGDDGSALTTLTGSFLAAGSGAVVATLWDVNDSATSAFMDQFYYQLDRGLSPAVALRRAKLRLLKDAGWNRPALWSAYIIVGDAGPLAPAAQSRWLLIVVAASIAALLALGIYRVVLGRNDKAGSDPESLPALHKRGGD